MLRSRSALSRAFAPAVVAGLALLLGGGAVTASAAMQTISSSGPLTNIYLSDDTACQVDHTGDTGHEFFLPSSTHGDCGTFLWAGGAQTPSNVFGPNPVANNSEGGFKAYSLVSQSAVTGSGASGDPFQVVTVVDAGSTGLRITQTDSYVVGNEFYRTDIKVSNSTSSDITVALYHGADCFLQESDFGFGWHDPVGGGIYCTKNANNSPAGRIEGFVPLSAGSNYIETHWPGPSGFWSRINGTQFPNTCDCTTFEDNTAGLSWSVTVPKNGSVTRSLFSAFSPTGAPPPPPTQNPTSTTVKCEPSTVVAGQSTTCTATVTDTATSGQTTPTGTVSFTTSGPGSFSKASCKLSTVSSSSASCSVTYTPGSTPSEPVRKDTITATYGGDETHEGSKGTTTVTVISSTALAHGAFVIGDKNAVVGKSVTYYDVEWWGSDWWKRNSLSGGRAPSAFKGFAESSPSPPSCGETWTTDTGNSSGPPATVPEYMEVIGASKITQSGSTVTGNAPKVAVVKTNPGYLPDPGHRGTGKVVAIVCES